MWDRRGHYGVGGDMGGDTGYRRREGTIWDGRGYYGVGRDFMGWEGTLWGQMGGEGTIWEGRGDREGQP